MKLLKAFFAEMSAALSDPKQAEAEFSRHCTPRAREVFELAQDEAAGLNHNFIGTEHVLLGLVKLNRGVAANVLRRQAVDLKKVRTAVEACVGRGPDVKILHPVPLTPRVRTVLVTAQKEARSLNHTYVGTEHILLGLLCENDSVAGRVLEGFGLGVAQIRQEILKELDPNFLTGDELSQG